MASDEAIDKLATMTLDELREVRNVLREKADLAGAILAKRARQERDRRGLRELARPDAAGEPS